MGDSNVEAVPAEDAVDTVNETNTIPKDQNIKTSATSRATSHLSRKQVQIKEKSALSKAGSVRSRSENLGRIVSATPSKRSQSLDQKDESNETEVKNEWNITLGDDSSDSDSSQSSSSRAASVISDQPRRRHRRY